MFSDTLITIFGYEIKWYSALILLGVVISYILVMAESNKFQIKKEFIVNLIFWTIIFGILGARTYYVLFNLDYYKENLSEIYKIWHGGLAIHGAIIAGFITILSYCKKYKVNTKKILDICAPALMISQAIGRWGNFFNREAFGSTIEYDALVKMRIIPQFVIDNMYIDGTYHLPMFYFESLLCLLGFIIILYIRRRKYIKNGQIFSFYMIWYGFIRYFIEYFRTDSLMMGPIKIAQLVSVIMVLIGIYIIIVHGRKPKLDDLYNKRDEEIKF